MNAGSLAARAELGPPKKKKAAASAPAAKAKPKRATKSATRVDTHLDYSPNETLRQTSTRCMVAAGSEPILRITNCVSTVARFSH